MWEIKYRFFVALRKFPLYACRLMIGILIFISPSFNVKACDAVMKQVSVQEIGLATHKGLHQAQSQ